MSEPNAPNDVLKTMTTISIPDRQREVVGKTVDNFIDWKGISRFFNLKEDEFKTLIKGKTVLDSGAGYNGLAVSAYYDQLPQKVVSISPGMINRQIWESQRKLNPSFIAYKEQCDPVKFSQAVAKADTDALNEITFSMPSVPGNSVDIAFDIRAAFMYEKLSGFFAASVRELSRVLKPGGVVYVDDSQFLKTPWKVDIVKNNNFTFDLLKDGLGLIGPVLKKPTSS